MAETINTIRKISNIPAACRERYLDLDLPAARSLRDLGVGFGGVSRLCPGYRIGNPRPDRIMVIATLSGRGTYRLPDRTWELTGGSLLVAPPVSAWSFAVSADHWHIDWAYLNDLPRWADLRSAGIALTQNWPVEEFDRCMQGYIANTHRPERAGLYALLVSSHLHDMLTDSTRSRPPSLRDTLDGVLSQVRRSPEREWTIDGIARSLHMSVSTLQRRVRELYGTTTWQLVVRARMDVAEQMLRGTPYPLKVIADRVGYADEFVFSTAFKRYAGVSPTAFRRRART